MFRVDPHENMHKISLIFIEKDNHIRLIRYDHFKKSQIVMRVDVGPVSIISSNHSIQYEDKENYYSALYNKDTVTIDDDDESLEKSHQYFNNRLYCSQHNTLRKSIGNMVFVDDKTDIEKLDENKTWVYKEKGAFWMDSAGISGDSEKINALNAKGLVNHSMKRSLKKIVRLKLKVPKMDLFRTDDYITLLNDLYISLDVLDPYERRLQRCDKNLDPDRDYWTQIMEECKKQVLLKDRENREHQKKLDELERKRWDDQKLISDLKKLYGSKWKDHYSNGYKTL